MKPRTQMMYGIMLQEKLTGPTNIYGDYICVGPVGLDLDIYLDLQDVNENKPEMRSRILDYVIRACIPKIERINMKSRIQLKDDKDGFPIWTCDCIKLKKNICECRFGKKLII